MHLDYDAPSRPSWDRGIDGVALTHPKGASKPT